MTNEIADKIFASMPHVQCIWILDGNVFIHPVAKAEKVLRPMPVKEVKVVTKKKGAKEDVPEII
jgi:hypothetical protein